MIHQIRNPALGAAPKGAKSGPGGRPQGCEIRNGIPAPTACPILAVCAFLAACVLASLAGCHRPPIPPKVVHCLASAEEIDRVHSVAFIELDSPAEFRDIAHEASRAVLEAIQARKRFQLRLVSRETPVVRDHLPPDGQPLALADLAALRRQLNADGLIIGTLRDFQPYPRMKMSLRLNLIDARRATVLWTVDDVWDSTERKTAERVERYFGSQQSDEFRPADWRLALMSPKAFEGFMAFEAASTLPMPVEIAEPVPPVAPRRPAVPASRPSVPLAVPPPASSQPASEGG